MLSLDLARSLIFTLVGLAPLLLLTCGLLTRGSLTRGSLRGRLLVAVVAPALVCGLLALLGGRPVGQAGLVSLVVLTYTGAWAGIHAGLGARRVAALVVALLGGLPVAATFAPNAVVESPAGQLVHSAGPSILVHLNPVICLGHRLLDQPVLVDHYFYHQGAAAPPEPLAAALVYATVAAVGLAAFGVRKILTGLCLDMRA